MRLGDWQQHDDDLSTIAIDLAVAAAPLSRSPQLLPPPWLLLSALSVSSGITVLYCKHLSATNMASWNKTLAPLILLLTLLANLMTPLHANTQTSFHTTPSFPASSPPTSANTSTFTHPLLSTINYHTATNPSSLQPGALNYFNFSRPEGTREFYLYVPTTYNNKTAWPFTFYFHGYTSDYRQGIMLNMTTDAEAAGYLIAFGQGTPTTTGPTILGWNGGECCLFNDSTTVDDVEFTRVALSMVQSAAHIDSTRQYAMGWSNGGFMVERIACETGSLFAGIAADASAVGILPGGQAGLAYCDKVFGANYTNYIHFHGTGNNTIPHALSHDTHTR